MHETEEDHIPCRIPTSRLAQEQGAVVWTSKGLQFDSVARADGGQPQAKEACRGLLNLAPVAKDRALAADVDSRKSLLVQH